MKRRKRSVLMMSKHPFEDPARMFSSQDPSPLYRLCSESSYPLTDEPFEEDAETMDLDTFFAKTEGMKQASPLYQQCLHLNFPITEELPPDEAHCTPINDAFPEEDDDVLETLIRTIHQPKSKDERIESLKNAISEKAVGLAEVKKLLLDHYDFKVIDGQCHIKDGCTWYPLNESDLALLIDCLSPELFDSLSHNAGHNIYQKLIHTTSLRVNHDDLEVHPNLIPCIDGVYDVLTGRVYDSAYDKDFFYRVNVRVREIGKGPGSIYESFLEKSFGDADDAIVCYEQCQGVILSGYAPRRIFAYVGPPGSGKSVSSNLLSKFLKNHTNYGSELCFIKSVDSPNRLSKNFGLGDLANKQLCLCGDMAKVGLSNDTCAILKQLSGGDIIRGEQKFKDSFEFVNKAKILLLSNNPLRGAIDDALRDRLVIVPFSSSVPVSERILHFEDRLFEERGYVFYRCMRALKDLIDSGFNFMHVEESENWISEGSVAADVSIAPFISQMCVLDPEKSTPLDELHRAYLEFCDKAQYAPVLSGAQFGKQLRTSCPMLKPVRNKRFRSYQGIALRYDTQSPM